MTNELGSTFGSTTDERVDRLCRARNELYRQDARVRECRKELDSVRNNYDAQVRQLEVDQAEYDLALRDLIGQ